MVRGVYIDKKQFFAGSLSTPKRFSRSIRNASAKEQLESFSAKEFCFIGEQLGARYNLKIGDIVRSRVT